MRQDAGFHMRLTPCLSAPSRQCAPRRNHRRSRNIPTHGKFDRRRTNSSALYEFKDGLNRYWPTAPPVRGRWPAVAYNTREKDREMTLFAQELFVNAQPRDHSQPGVCRGARASKARRR